MIPLPPSEGQGLGDLKESDACEAG